MSKYYKAEDMENLIINIAPDGEVFELGMSALQSLPTIEVSLQALTIIVLGEKGARNDNYNNYKGQSETIKEG